MADYEDLVFRQRDDGREVTVINPTPDQRAAFVQATRPVYEKWAKTIGADLVKKAEGAIAKR